MHKKAAVAAAVAAIITTIIGLTMQATAYALAGGDSAPWLLGLILTICGLLTLAADTPILLSIVRTAAHDDAYLTLLADQRHDHATARTVRPLERRAQ